MMELSEVSTRFMLTLAMLASVLGIAVVVMGLAAYDKPVPDFISGVVLAGFMLMLKDAYTSYFKAREELQATRTQ